MCFPLISICYKKDGRLSVRFHPYLCRPCYGRHGDYYDLKYHEVNKYQHKRVRTLTARKLVRLVIRLLKDNRIFRRRAEYTTRHSDTRALFQKLQGQGFGLYCLFAAYTALFTQFRSKFSCITVLTSYHRTLSLILPSFLALRDSTFMKTRQNRFNHSPKMLV